VWPGMYYSMGCGLGCIIAGIFIAPRMRDIEAVVPMDYFEARFGSHKAIRGWAWLSNVPSLLGIFVAQLLACGSILAAFGIPFWIGVVVCALVILVYASMGGMWSVVVGDTVNIAVIMVGIPVAVVQVLGLDDLRLGVTQAAMGLGGLLGGGIAAVLGERLRLRRGSVLLVTASLTVAGMGAALLPGTAPLTGWWVVTAMSAVMMALATVLTVLLTAAVQRQTPPEFLGKVMAFLTAAANCASPLGQAAYGALFEGLPAWTVLMGAAMAAVLVSAYSSRVFRALEGPLPG